ncbi:hypothetical protein KGF54_005651 [Candida jiufengensis]|uniref:uncharacterized protein n=1 Tax=Candida jiufengensis TaxID=497108 RepID=UPI00222593F3|nr:uncharacterized protein KGF54_005651 [Candida jiufengensis]KAI5949416.1 hypothetical protein KGF54_005651 [Candida jiufengensis]
MSAETDSIESPIAFKSPQDLSISMDFSEDSVIHSPTQRNISRSSSPFITHPESPSKSQEELVVPRNISPWRQFRSIKPSITTTTSSSIFHNKPDLGPDANNVFIDTNSKEEELNKRIINYKIQIKLMKNFLQDLIEKNKLDPKELKSIMPIEEFKDASLSSAEIELNALKKDYDELYKLNQDMFTSFGEFEQKIKVRDLKLREAGKLQEVILENAQTHGIEQDLPIDIQLKRLLDKLNYKSAQTIILTPPSSDNGKDTDIIKQLEIEKSDLFKQLESQNEEITELKHKLELAQNQNHTNSSNNVHIQNEETIELKNKLAKEQELTKSLQTQNEEFIILRNKVLKDEELTKQLHAQQEENDKLRQKISEDEGSSEKIKIKNEEINNLKQKVAFNKDLTKDIEAQSQEINDLKQKLVNEDQVDVVKQYQAQIQELNTNLDSAKKASQEYQQQLQALQNEHVKLQQHANNYNLQESSLMTEYLDLQNAYSKIIEELNSTTESLSILKQSNDKALNEKSTELRNQQIKIENLKNELTNAIDNQRKNYSEKIQTSYQNESLQKENESLKSKIDKLTEFMHFQQNDNKNQDNIKKLSIVEFQYKDLLTFDMTQFSKLLKSFNKVAEDESILNPTRKYEKIMRKLSNFTLDEKDINFIRENHKSISNYFVRATDMIINDHVRLLLKENDHVLQKQNERLTEQNSQLSKVIEELKSGGGTDSSITELRFNDIRRRWKAERERRIFEDSEAQKKFRELEDEIANR